jgi:hypothetical protein
VNESGMALRSEIGNDRSNPFARSKTPGIDFADPKECFAS